MSRDSARTAAAENGATIDLGVTKKTTILVVGDFDPTTLRTGAILSTKVQKHSRWPSGGNRSTSWSPATSPLVED